jgi:predicted transcriptional regulator
MSKEKISKLPIINKHDALVGIVSQYDLRELVKDKSQQQGGRYNRRGEKRSYLNVPISEYMVSMVITVDRIPHFSQAAQLMLERSIGSLVIIDNQNKPLDIITKRDLLQTIAAASL